MKLEIQGKWANISRMVRNLIDDGWTQQSIEPNEAFTLTTVVLIR